MAIPLTTRISALQTEVRQQRDLIQQQRDRLGQQEAILNVQFKRIADIQAELDLVKATVRLAAPEHAARFWGAHPGARNPASPAAA
jgi:hypothetical protein